ncbi:MAG: signal peptidase I [Clostridia bacterium]|nr:signal peptidase I [Clostridia bacterium]
MYKINDSLNEIQAKEKKSRRNFYAVVLVLLFLTVLIIHLNFFVFINIEVSGESMESTLQSGDNLIAVRGATVHRGDIIIIDKNSHNVDSSDNYYYIIKRAIGIGGDIVQIRTDGYVYLNGEKLNESYLDEGQRTYVYEASFPVNRTYVLAEDEIFYLGDNRVNSSDARVNGPCKKSDVIGVVMNWTVKHRKSLTKVLNFFKSIPDWFSGAFGCGGNKS